MNPCMKDITAPTVVSLLAALTANQEQIEWWLRCGASLVALVAGALAIYRFFRPRKRDRLPLDCD